MIVYAVVYNDYEPTEVDTLWLHSEAAHNRCKEKNEESITRMWRMITMTVHEERE